ncbi:Lipase [Fusarium sp. Ph1]|nr:Lipase [Fusarium sp. Ph1]
MMLVLSILSIIAFTAAGPVPSVDENTRALEHRAVTVTNQDLSNFRFYLQHADAAYCNFNTAVGKPVHCSAGNCPDIEKDAAIVVGSVVGTKTGIGAYVATDNARKEIVVSVRGSINVRNWITNFNFGQKTCDLVAGCGVHTGFLDAWEEVAANIKAAVSAAKTANPTFKFVATGHSLGGAVATVAAAYLRKDGFPFDLYTYGSPRVGNDFFANFVTQQAGAEYRVTHGDDPVPRLPPIVFGYRHTSPEYWLDGGPLDKDYTVSEIKVCEGIANVMCNGGTIGLDILAHITYFQSMATCAPIAIPWKRDMSDEELEKKLTQYSEMDQEFVKQMT